MEILNVNGWNLFYNKNYSNVVDIRFTVLGGSEKEENSKIHGVAHFVEHLMFKGTRKRGYLDISDEIAAIGGQGNAFSSRSVVSYYIRVVKMNWGKAFEILSDMFFNSVFDEKEIEKERNVILEEAKNSIDDHESFVMEEGILDTLYHARGHRVIGTPESISSISRKGIVALMKMNYKGYNVLVSISGNVEKDDIFKNISDLLPASGREPKRIYIEKNTLFKNNRLLLHRDKLQQSYLLLFYQGVGKKHPLYFAQKVLLNAIGGGMHSLLFKKIREECGLCYHIDAGEILSFNDFSLICISANLSKENVEKTKEIVFQLLNAVKSNGLEEKLLEISKVDYTSYIAMNTETSTGYVIYYAINYLLDIYKNFDAIYTLFNVVSNNQITEIAELIFKEPKEIFLS